MYCGKYALKLWAVVFVFFSIVFIAYHLWLSSNTTEHSLQRVTLPKRTTPSMSKTYLDQVKMEKKNQSFLKGSLLTPQGKSLHIFLHFPGDAVTNSILSSHQWEPHTVGQWDSFIRAHPGIQALDLGCNLGVFSLVAASLGSRVVAVDANPENTVRVAQSLLENGFQGTVLTNAVSDRRQRLVLDKSANSIASYRVKDGGQDPGAVEAIFLDDLVPLFDRDQPVAIKIDIEAKEIDAIRRASTFFAERNVLLVIMEWEHIKKLSDIGFLIEFFDSRHFQAYSDYLDPRKKLALDQFMTWPQDVYWIK